MRDTDKSLLINSFWEAGGSSQRSDRSRTVVIHGRRIDEWNRDKIREITTISADRDIIDFNVEGFDTLSLLDAVHSHQDPISQWAKQVSGVNDAIEMIATDTSKIPSILTRKQFSLFFALQNIQNSQIVILDNPTIYMSEKETRRFFTDLKQQIDRSNIVVIVLSNDIHDTIHSEYSFTLSKNGSIQPCVIDEAYEEDKEISSTVRKDILDSDPYSADKLREKGFARNNISDDGMMNPSTDPVSTSTSSPNYYY